MEAEASLFETSEILSTFLASTPLLLESWKLCDQANRSVTQSDFLINRVGEVTYVAFSGIQSFDALDPKCRNLMPLNGNVIFSAFQSQGDHGEEPFMVHAGFLYLFLSVYNSPTFQNQMFEIMKESKSVVFTGHSIGGTIASLSALWLLSNLKSLSSPLSVLSITFGSPLLGNESLSKVILQERWGGKFWNVVTKHDIVPRLLLAPIFSPNLNSLLQYWQLSMSSRFSTNIIPQLSEYEKDDFFRFVLAHVKAIAKAEYGSVKSRFWPLGNYMFCTDEGAICVDNSVAVVQLLYLFLATGSSSSCIEDHLKYGDRIGNVSMQFLKRRDNIMQSELQDYSSYEVGITLALQSSGIAAHESVSEPMKDCLKTAKRMGRTPNLNSANLAIGLSRIAPLRVQIEWYKATCDKSDDQMGYYDTFKRRGAVKRDSKINMNRIKLAQFWDDLIQMMENNQLPHNFHKRAKWVYASQFYKLLVEPLDIAEYYRIGMHLKNGHYINHGRERRYKIFDRWWRERTVGEGENNIKRSKFASLTQDTCFWARVEEAWEWLNNVRSERDARKLSMLWEKIDDFEKYARTMVERKEVSIDVVGKNSSYSLWVEERKGLKSQLQQQFSPRFLGFLGGEIVP